MKVSLNWIKQFIDFELPPVDELVERIGAQLGAVEGAENLEEKYQGIIVAKVVNCVPHENSDHLRICKIDDGGKVQNVERDENGYVQVVCGAPNVREGLTVAWLPPGTTVPESVGKDPFLLETREIRGAKSNGMLASQRELALGDSHEGILEIDKEAQPGSAFVPVYKLDDYIIDIENKMFTHRPDCFGALGVAREVAGILGQQFTSPDWYKADAKMPVPTGNTLPLEVRNELPELVPRFMAVVVQDIQVKPSPIWLQVALSKVGVKPINNVVDLTNFYMLVTGQPTHAYDYDKVRELSSGDTPTIVVRYPKEGEKIRLLNGKEIEPRPEAIMIATDQKLIGVGGVMGGAETEVDEHTKNIIIECATFDMYSIRRTSMANGLFTEAVTRFTKGQSPLQNQAVLAKLVEDITKLSGGSVASNVIDERHLGAERPPVTVSAGFINERLGLKLRAQEITDVLANVEFGSRYSEDHITIDKIPFWRTDIEIPEDVVEEVGRLYGFDKLPLTLPKRSLQPAKKDEILELKSRMRSVLAKAGANEVLTYSFVHGDLLKKVGQNPESAFQIANALSPDLQYYRLSLAPSLLEKVYPNIKAGHDEFALFEIGKGHLAEQNGDDGLPREDDLTALVVAAADRLKKTGAAYYQAKKYLETLIPAALTYKPVPEAMQAFDITKPFDMNRTAFVYAGETFLGLIGEFQQAVKRSLKLPKYCAGFELDTVALAPFIGRTSYTSLSRFPKVEQDITLKVPANVPYGELYAFLRDELTKIQPVQTAPSLSPVGIYQGDSDQTNKHVTLRLTIASYEKTLRDSEVNELLDKVATAAHVKFGAERL